MKNLYIKEHYQESGTTTHRKRNICKPYIQKGLVSGIHRELLYLNNNKTNNPILKMGKILE